MVSARPKYNDKANVPTNRHMESRKREANGIAVKNSAWLYAAIEDEDEKHIEANSNVFSMGEARTLLLKFSMLESTKARIIAKTKETMAGKKRLEIELCFGTEANGN